MTNQDLFRQNTTRELEEEEKFATLQITKVKEHIYLN